MLKYGVQISPATNPDNIMSGDNDDRTRGNHFPPPRFIIQTVQGLIQQPSDHHLTSLPHLTHLFGTVYGHHAMGTKH